MSVDDWARREADKAWAWEEPAATAYVQGIVHAFSAFLSDEAVRAMQTQLINSEQPYIPGHELYAALQAAIDAVTKEARND